jgi:hypothetical protein
VAHKKPRICYLSAIGLGGKKNYNPSRKQNYLATAGAQKFFSSPKENLRASSKFYLGAKKVA